ncbi:MAG: hypothetical protein U0935_08010 [Pirellulales bacterium]
MVTTVCIRRLILALTLFLLPASRMLAGEAEETGIVRRAVPQHLAGHQNSVFSIEVSPAGDRLLSGGADRKVILWDTMSGAQRAINQDPGGGMLDVAFATGDSVVLAGGDPGEVLVLDATDLQLRRKLSFPFRSSRFDTHGGRHWVAVGGVTGTILLYDYRSGTAVREFPIHGSRVLGLAFSPDGETLWTAGDQPGSGEKIFTLRATNTRTGASVELARLPGRPVRMSLHGERLALTAGPALLVFHLPTGQMEQQWTLPEGGEAQQLVYWPQHQLYVSASPTGRVDLWRPGSPRAVGSFRGHERALFQTLPLDKQRLVTAAASGQQGLTIWTLELAGLPGTDATASSGAGKSVEPAMRSPGNPRPAPPPPPPMPQPSPQPSPKPMVPAPDSKSDPPTLPRARLAVPDAALRGQSLEKIREVFRDDYDKSKKGGDRAALARKFLQLAQDSRSDPPAHYVLLSEATRHALAGGDLDLTLQLIRELEQWYEVDAWGLRVTAFNEIATHKMLDRRQLTVAALTSAAAAVEAGELTRAGDILRVAAAASTQVRDTKLRADVAARRKELEELGRIAELGAAAGRRLETDPENAKAHLARGRYLILIRRDWNAGLDHLARGDDERLRSCAVADRADPRDVAATLAVADQWWDAGQSATGLDKHLCLARALVRYRQVAGAAAALDKLRAERRIKEIRDSVPANWLVP